MAHSDNYKAAFALINTICSSSHRPFPCCSSGPIGVQLPHCISLLSPEDLWNGVAAASLLHVLNTSEGHAGRLYVSVPGSLSVVW